MCSVQNIRHKIASTRFMLSNHNLLIEKGKHFRPKIERNERKCFLCKRQKSLNEMAIIREVCYIIHFK